MANTPTSRWTVKDVLSMVREITDTVDQRKILTEQGRYFYNAALSEIVSLLNSSTDPAYFNAESISLTNSLLHSTYGFIGATLTGMSNQYGTMTITSTKPAAGAIVTIWSYRTSDGLSNLCLARVTSVVGDTVYVSAIIGGVPLIPGSVYDYATVTWMDNPSNDTFNATTLAYNYDRIVSIWDSTYGQCVEVTLDQFYSIGRSDFQHKSYDNDIIWTMAGNTIYFRNGAKITSPGTKTVIYQRQPRYPTLYDDTEYPDIADKYIPLLVKRIYTYIILQKESDIPKNLAQEMQLDYASIAAYAGVELSNRNKGNTQVDKK